MKTFVLQLGAATLLGSLFLAACGDDDTGDTESGGKGGGGKSTGGSSGSSSAGQSTAGDSTDSFGGSAGTSNGTSGAPGEDAGGSSGASGSSGFDAGGAAPAGESVPLGDVASITLGDWHTCVLTTAGAVLCWGFNGNGELGIGTNKSRGLPLAVTGISDVSAIDAGSTTTCAVLSNGEARCWGANNQGELGNNSMTHSQTPVVVGGVAGASEISVGDTHVCANAGDDVWCWGNNAFGAFGNGAATSSLVPISISGLGDAQLAAARLYTCGLIGDGVQCWGANAFGQLGLGDTTGRLSPTAIPGLTGVSAVDTNAGASHTCALLATGAVKCWGRNLDGQLGNNTTTDSWSPIDVPGITTAVAIAVGGSGSGEWAGHSCALLSDGTAKCWGDNEHGQLGNGNTTPQLAPVLVSGLSDAIAIAAGRAHTCAIISDGSVKCWGANDSGQLGNRSTTDQATPVTVLDFDAAEFCSGVCACVGAEGGNKQQCDIDCTPFITGGASRLECEASLRDSADPVDACIPLCAAIPAGED